MLLTFFYLSACVSLNILIPLFMICLAVLDITLLIMNGTKILTETQRDKEKKLQLKLENCKREFERDERGKDRKREPRNGEEKSTSFP